ncbi:unannotated protein [freshwater metagenome]|uniref:Unannotated protein n=1 Tax=freshwater metagenome TaxID=449393 RepID=A0A6J7H343_9ZZZZ
MPAGFTATPLGSEKPVRVAVIVFVFRFTTDTVLLSLLGTYAKVPAGFTATPNGVLKPVIVAVTVFVFRFTTDTVPTP